MNYRAIVAALIFGIAGLAAPVAYNIQFDPFPNPPNFDITPTAGSFTFDAENPVAPFSGFIVVWRGTPFDLTVDANTESALGFGCDSQSIAPPYGVNIVFRSFGPPCGNVDYRWVGNYSPGANLQIFSFRAENLDCCGQIQIDAVLAINDPDGTFQSGQGSWTVTARAGAVAPCPIRDGRLTVDGQCRVAQSRAAAKIA